MAFLCAVTPAAALTPAGGVTGTGQATAPAGGPEPRAGRSDPDLIAMGEIWKRQAAAWARGDANAYASMYTPDADLINIRGEHLHGRTVIAARIQHYFNNQLKNTRILRLAEQIRRVSPTMAIIIRKDCVLYGAETTCSPVTLSINSSIVVKRQGKWLIESFHNTLVHPEDGRQRPF